MGEGRPGDGLHVVRGHEVTARHGGPRAGDLQQGQRAPRARADLDLAVTPRRPHDVDNVPLDGGIDVDVLDRGLQPPHLVRRGHRFDRGVVRPALPPAFEDLDLLFPRRIADVDPEEEPVHLGLRERVGAFVFDRILRRNDEERPVEGERLALEGRLPFLHRLEQGGLRLRGGPVDLVRQEELGEDRTAAEDEVARLAVVHVGARDVRGQEVRGELDPPEGEAEARREGLRNQRLRQTRHVLDQEVSIAEDRPEHPFEDGPLADDHGFHGVKEGSADRGHGREVHRQASMRASTSWNSRVKPPRSRARRTQAYRPSRSPARTWRNSARTGSPNTRRRASGSCCTAYIPAGVRPNDSRACSRKAARAREVTRTWLYRSPRAARRTDAATVSSSPGSYASGEAGRTSGAGSDVPPGGWSARARSRGPSGWSLYRASTKRDVRMPDASRDTRNQSTASLSSSWGVRASWSVIPRDPRRAQNRSKQARIAVRTSPPSSRSRIVARTATMAA